MVEIATELSPPRARVAGSSSVPDYDDRVTRAVVSLLLALALLVGAAPAHADDPVESDVAINVTSITPDAISSPSDSITVKGTLTNQGEETITDLRVQWRYLPDTISTSTDLDKVIAADPTAGSVTAGPALLSDEIEPGEATPFDVRIPSSAVDATPEELATVVTLEFMSSADDEDTIVAADRLFVPHASNPRELVDPVFLTAVPSRIPASNYVPDELQEAITGPLLTAATTVDDEIVVIDPALYAAAVKLAEREPLAQQFLDAVDALHDADQVWCLPYGNPNLLRLPDAATANLPQWMENTTPETLASAPTVAFTSANEPVEGFDETLTFGEDPELRRIYRLTDEAKARVLSDLPAVDTSIAFPTDGEPWEQVGGALARIDDFPEIREELVGPVDQSEIQALTLSAHSTHFPDEAAALAYVERAPITNFDPADISLSVSPSFIMTERESQFPVTVTNGTGMPVSLRVGFTSDNPQRIDVDDTDPFEVGAGESFTVLVSPKAESNGATMVHAQLESLAGRKLGPVNDVEVTATELGRVGWIIIIASGVFVLAGTAWRIRNVRKEQAKESSESGQ